MHSRFDIPRATDVGAVTRSRRDWRASSVAFLCLAAPMLVAAVSASRAADMDVSRDPSYNWGESKVIVNPKNANNIIIATQGIGFTDDCQKSSHPNCKIVMANLAPQMGFRIPQAQGLFLTPDFNIAVAIVSFDRGKTWKTVKIPVVPPDHPNLTGGGDPNIAATADGTLYFSFDDNDWGTVDQPLPAAAVSVVKSTDGGLTWSPAVPTGTPVDGPKITSDVSTGTIYEASSTNLGPHSTGDAKSPQGKLSDRWVVSSTDGVHWSTPQPMGGSGGSMSAAHGLLATAFTGTSHASLFAAANGALCGSAPQPCVVFETTGDAGATWSRYVLTGAGGGAATPGGGPMVAADPTKAGHFVVAVPVNGHEFDVYQTRDAGKTWSKPTIVTEDATKDHFHPWMDYSPKGVLGIMWRTRQPAPGQAPAPPPASGMGFPSAPSTPYNVWAAVSKDGGTTFSKPLKVSSADSPAPPAGAFANAGDDYSSIALYGDHVYVTWADWRSGGRAMHFGDSKLQDFKFK
jgi:hypothetical protein